MCWRKEWECAEGEFRVILEGSYVCDGGKFRSLLKESLGLCWRKLRGVLKEKFWKEVRFLLEEI